MDIKYEGKKIQNIKWDSYLNVSFILSQNNKIKPFHSNSKPDM